MQKSNISENDELQMTLPEDRSINRCAIFTVLTGLDETTVQSKGNQSANRHSKLHKTSDGQNNLGRCTVVELELDTKYLQDP